MVLVIQFIAGIDPVVSRPGDTIDFIGNKHFVNQTPVDVGMLKRFFGVFWQLTVPS
jgi:hypothetical protein